MRSRARASRYLRNRSQLTRSCQSNPTAPTFAIYFSVNVDEKCEADRRLYRMSGGPPQPEKGLMSRFRYILDQSWRPQLQRADHSTGLPLLRRAGQNAESTKGGRIGDGGLSAKRLQLRANRLQGEI